MVSVMVMMSMPRTRQSSSLERKGDMFQEVARLDHKVGDQSFAGDPA